MHKLATLAHVNRTIIPVSPAARFVNLVNQLPRQPIPAGGIPANSMQSWILARTQEVCGATNFADASKNPSFNTLVGFGYLKFSEGSSPASLPAINLYDPPPAFFTQLEPDFFPTLLTQLQTESKQSPAFAQKMTGAQQEFGQVVDRLQKAPIRPVSGGLQPAISQEEGGAFGLVVLAILAVAWAVGLLKDDNNS